jgi:cellulose synthase/poly-beta-1,6-N-acetylglucosamine synthase-like glycosyltransferase
MYLSFAVFYHLFLAVVYFLKGERQRKNIKKQYKFLLLIPAHNEEQIIGRLLESIKKLDYDINLFKVMVIVDNCIDKTAEIVKKYNIKILARTDKHKTGKGFAIEWALERIDINKFDAIVIVDADNIIDTRFFHGLNEIIAEGINAIQCYNGLANPDESAFASIMHLSRTIDNELYHHAKYKIGLSSFLMGNGMCFTSKILKNYGWSASTLAEDYEYYAKLIEKKEMVGFAANARLYHQESKGINQATSQRLRWSSGKFEIARKYGVHLLKKGLKERNYKIVDASFPLILPNLSLMVNMTFMALLISILIHFIYPISGVIIWLLFLILLEIAYFFIGIFLTKIPILKFVYAFSFAPVFLLWKGYIDIKGIFGEKKRQWGSSRRF